MKEKKRKEGRIAGIAIVACLAILLFSGIASAETGRQKVVKEACRVMYS